MLEDLIYGLAHLDVDNERYLDYYLEFMDVLGKYFLEVEFIKKMEV